MFGRRTFSVAPARRPGTRYQTTCEIRRVPLTVFARTWKLFFSRSTSVHSANAILRLFSIHKSSGVTMGWLLRLVTGAPLVVGCPDSSRVLSD